MGYEMGMVVENIANRQLLLKRYAEAERSYKRALELAESLTARAVDTITKAILVGDVYYQLGMVAQEQRQPEKPPLLA